MTGKANPAQGDRRAGAGLAPFFLPDFSAYRMTAPPETMNRVTQQYAQSALVSLNLLETWIGNSRNIADTWRTILREQQDSVLAMMRTQLNATQPHKPAKGTASQPGKTA